MPASELVEWEQWHGRNGFPVERVVWGIALAAQYIGGVWGGKLQARDLVPRLESPDAKRRRIRAAFDALVKPGGNV